MILVSPGFSDDGSVDGGFDGGGFDGGGFDGFEGPSPPELPRV
jgi:hypothetical protein